MDIYTIKRSANGHAYWEHIGRIEFEPSGQMLIQLEPHALAERPALAQYVSDSPPNLTRTRGRQAGITECVPCGLVWVPGIFGPHVGQPCPRCGIGVAAHPDDQLGATVAHVTQEVTECPNCGRWWASWIFGPKPGYKCTGCGEIVVVAKEHSTKAPL